MYCGREELPFVWALGFITSTTFYIHNNLYNTLKEREKKVAQKFSFKHSIDLTKNTYACILV